MSGIIVIALPSQSLGKFVLNWLSDPRQQVRKVKAKVNLEEAMKAPKESIVTALLFLQPRPFTPGKEPQHPVYRWVGAPLGRSEWMWKISPQRDSIPGPSSPYVVYVYIIHMRINILSGVLYFLSSRWSLLHVTAAYLSNTLLSKQWNWMKAISLHQYIKLHPLY
jgi:hypothetical protein